MVITGWPGLTMTLPVKYSPSVLIDHRAAPGRPAGPPGRAAEETFARAVEHGDEHVIKFADTAADVYARAGNPDALATAVRAIQTMDR